MLYNVKIEEINMATTEYPILEKVKDLAAYIPIAVGVLYITKLVFGLSFNFGINF